MSVMVTPPAGAGADRVIGYGTGVREVNVTGDGTLIVPLTTVTLAVASAMFGALARIVTGPPCATPVTGTGTLVEPAGITTVAGTVATPVLLELTFSVTPPAGAGAERVRVRFWVVPV